jgi:4-amino-4-deoxy-L-arabinose transferase-like glycosyltransferase
LREILKRAVHSTGFIVVVAFVVRLEFLLVYFRHYVEPAVVDHLRFGAELGSVAAAIAAGHGFSSPLYKYPTGPTAWFTPIYPYLLAAIFKLFGTFTYSSNLMIRTINVALSAFTCWPIAAIGDKAFGKPTGKVAAWAWAVCPTAVYYSIIWVWDTSLAGLWLAMLFAATLWLRGSNRLSWWIGYGALWGIAALINPSLLAVLPFLALWAIWPLRRQLGQSAKLAAAASLIFVACIAPWSVRNYMVFHQFVPLRSNFGLELWLGNNSAGLDTSNSVNLLHPSDNTVEGPKFVSMTEIPYMQEKQREGFAFMRSHPAETVRSIFLRFEDNWLGMWDPLADVWGNSPLYARASMVWNCLFSLLSLCGVLFAYRARKEAADPFAMVLLVFPVLFYITHPSLRYRFPMDPLMQLLVAFAVVYPVSHLAEYLPAFSPGAQVSGESSN